MNRFEIRCSKEQARKAYELGAPIKANKDYSNGNLSETLCVYGDIINQDAYGIGECTILHIPTAEQIIGWLEERGLSLHTFKTGALALNENNKLIKVSSKGTRKDTTLAAIDAALDYLLNK